MKNKTKILSIILAVVFVLSTFAMSVSALEEPAVGTKSNVIGAQITLGQALGVTVYTDKPYAAGAKGTFEIEGRTKTVDAVNNNGYCVFVYKEIVPDEIDSTIQLVSYANDEDDFYISESFTLKQIAVAMLN